ncbi:MAG: helicase, partial [Planctomycetia bacterium]|nr:helicase [Planctomycetia bacterium]
MSEEIHYFTPQNVLGTDGLLARKMRGYEARPQQIAMAEAILDVFLKKQHLIVEAGTGVGKSFGYLVPAILTSCQEYTRPTSGATERPFRRVVISTQTISLQEQLIEKDLPFLNSLIPLEFSFTLVKGRSNYICLRRLESASRNALSLFTTQEEVEQLDDFRVWANQTYDGTQSDLHFAPLGRVWDEICCESGNCLGKKCAHYSRCFYQVARRRIRNAQILVVNHALFFSDLAVRNKGGAILPEYEAVVFDEAHSMEAVAGDHLGISLSNGQLEYMLHRLYNRRNDKGLLVQHGLKKAQRLADVCVAVANDFFAQLCEWYNDKVAESRLQARPKELRVRQKNVISNGLSEALAELAGCVYNDAAGIDSPEAKLELELAFDRLNAAAAAVDSWVEQNQEGFVYWLHELPPVRGRWRAPRVEMCAAPVDVGPILREKLFNPIDSVVLTSATLSTAKRTTRGQATRG